MPDPAEQPFFPDRTRLLSLSEEQLFQECRCDTMRGTGPGGQKRNKTESAVRLVHIETGLVAFDDEQRSQHTNRHHAIQKLRIEIALHCRCAASPWTQPLPGQSSDLYPVWAAVALDALSASQFAIADAVKILGCSTNQLIKQMAKSPTLWQFVNQERQKRGLSALRQ